MDDLFGLIVVIIIACVSLSKNSKKAKKNQNKTDAKPSKPIRRTVTAAKPTATATAALPKTAPAKPKSSLIEQELLRKAEELKALTGIDIVEHVEKKSAVKAVMKHARPLVSGESFTDKEGCIGGSLNVHTEEGESHAEHAQHMKRAERPVAMQNAAAERASALKNANLTDLRRAVIMSEILDKPVALRRR